MAAEQRDTERVAVKTYVPAYQRERWDESADDLDMSRSEFVRSMVQAGRRGFDPRGNGSETTEADDTVTAPDSDQPADTSETVSGVHGADAEAVDETVLELLDGECLSWQELIDELTESVEDRLDDAIHRLQERNEIQHDGREGGYVRLG